MLEHNFAIVIPAHNEQNTIKQLIQAASESYRCEVVVIDDASTDATTRIAAEAGAVVLPLAVQLGAWGAIQTGIRYALKRGYQTVVTMDADGQHETVSIATLLAPIAAGTADVVIGAFPIRASRARRIAWSYFRLLTNLKLQDITSGFRAYNRTAMNLLASPRLSLLDYQDIGVLLIARRKKLRLAEVSVTMRPRQEGKSRVFDSWLTVAKYMFQTSLLCLARIDFVSTKRPMRRRPAIR